MGGEGGSPLPNAAAAETIAEAGRFEFLIGDSEESGRVVLGRSAAGAGNRIQERIAKRTILSSDVT